MGPSLLHCPKCGALQPNQARCEVCEARLPGFRDPASADSATLAEAMPLAGYLVVFLGGFVGLGALLVVALVWLLG